MKLHELVHMYEIFHITLGIREYATKPNEKLYKNTQFCSSCVQISLVIGPITPTLQHNVNSSWHALIKRHAIMFTEIGIR
jgi:hypothetical protein